MYAVIFNARTAELDADYGATAAELRRLALEQYGCLEFLSVCEGVREVAISYWPSLEAISAWKADPRHRRAQQQAERWYRDYRVQVVEVLREYRG